MMRYAALALACAACTPATPPPLPHVPAALIEPCPPGGQLPAPLGRVVTKDRLAKAWKTAEDARRQEAAARVECAARLQALIGWVMSVGIAPTGG